MPFLANLRATSSEVPSSESRDENTRSPSEAWYREARSSVGRSSARSERPGRDEHHRAHGDPRQSLLNSREAPISDELAAPSSLIVFTSASISSSSSSSFPLARPARSYAPEPTSMTVIGLRFHGRCAGRGTVVAVNCPDTACPLRVNGPTAFKLQ